MKFDEDIERDLREGNIETLAMVAQDLREIMNHVAPRNMLAALRRKKKAEAACRKDYT